MNLNRRGFLQATGLTRLLAALGIELPEVKAQEIPRRARPVSERPILPISGNAFSKRIDFTRLDVEIVDVFLVARPPGGNDETQQA